MRSIQSQTGEQVAGILRAVAQERGGGHDDVGTGEQIGRHIAGVPTPVVAAREQSPIRPCSNAIHVLASRPSSRWDRV